MAEIAQCIAREEDDARIAADGYDVTGEEAYMIVDGYDSEARPPLQPSSLAYDELTGTISWAAQADAECWAIYANDFSNQSTSGRQRNTLVDTITQPSLSTTTSALSTSEWRTYWAIAYDDLSEIWGPPCKQVVAIESNRRGY